jgi:DNA (cytosine-5)-methyltransferase 1
MGKECSNERGARTAKNVDDPWGVTWIERESRPTTQEAYPSIAVADLFCGCGGLSLGVEEGLRQSGYRAEFVFAIDGEPEFIDVYARNFDVSDDCALSEDIRNYVDGSLGEPLSDNEQRLVDELPQIDLVVAGPPCQGHSDLNNHSRRDDDRNSLYLRAIRFVELFWPVAVLIENVPEVVHSKQQVVADAVDFLEKKGYSTKQFVAKATELRLPQRRKRHFLVAAPNAEFSKEGILQFEGEKSPAVEDYIEGLEDEPEQHDDMFHVASRMSEKNKERAEYLLNNSETFDLPDDLRPPCHQDGNHSYNSVYGQIRPDEPAQTITTGFGSMGQGRFLHPNCKRVITPHEAARIQGFPDYFDFQSAKLRTSLHTMIGNAVPPKLAAVMVRNLVQTGQFEFDLQRTVGFGQRSTIQTLEANSSGNTTTSYSNESVPAMEKSADSTNEPTDVDPKRSEWMSNVGQSDTPPEVAVRRLLHRMGFRYRTENPDLPGSPDIANRTRSWAVFVHGCFWHQHKGCERASIPKKNREFWEQKFERNKERDRRVQQKLEDAGFLVKVVWECQIEDSPKAVAEELGTALEEQY